jgi:2'-5' RNA ligase
MRLFFAIAVPDDLVRRVAAVQADLRAAMDDPGIRWTTPAQFHYTLKFLGEQPVQRAYKAVEVAQAVARAQRPFSLTLGGVGAFPGVERPNVVWLGASQGADALVGLAGALDAALARERFRREPKPARAHLTLARVKTYQAEVAVSSRLPRVTVGDVGVLEADAMVLMQSVLKPEGSEYSVVERFRFEG